MARPADKVPISDGNAPAILVWVVFHQYGPTVIYQHGFNPTGEMPYQ